MTTESAGSAAWDMLILFAMVHTVPILRALSQGPLYSEELRRQAGAPGKTTYYERLARLETLGAIEGGVPAEYPRRVLRRLGKPGDGLVDGFAVIDRWLTGRPLELAPLPDPAATETLRGLGEAGQAGIMSALAERPYHLAELGKRSADFTVNVIDTRLKRLGRTGLAESTVGPGRGRPWALTEAGRAGAAPFAWALRWASRDAPRPYRLTTKDCLVTLMMSLPLVERLPDPDPGICRFVVAPDPGAARSTRSVAILVRVEHGRVRECGVGVRGRESSLLRGPATAWLDALVAGRVEELEAGGDGWLAIAVLRALHHQLFAPR